MKVKRLETVPSGVRDLKVIIQRIKFEGFGPQDVAPEFFCIRNFTPSTRTEGHGVTFKVDAIPELIEALKRTQRHYGIGGGQPGEGQGTLL